jgi:hypothetical protein
VKTFLANHDTVDTVRFVLFTADVYSAFRDALGAQEA